MQDEGDCYFGKTSWDELMPPEPPLPPMYLPNGLPELFTIDEAVMQMFEMEPGLVFMERDLYGFECARFEGLPAEVEGDILACIERNGERRCIVLCDQFCWPDFFGDQGLERAKFPKVAFYEVWLRRSRYRIPLPKWLQECHDPYAFAEPDPQPEGGQMSTEEEDSAGYWAGLREEAPFQAECIRGDLIEKTAGSGGRTKGTGRAGRPRTNPTLWIELAKQAFTALEKEPKRKRTRACLVEKMADISGCSTSNCSRQLNKAEKELLVKVCPETLTVAKNA